jgi:tetratricopeptide (TPR) repeat protein
VIQPEKSPSAESLDEVFTSAMSHFLEGREPAAAELFAEYLRHRPDDIETRFHYGESLRILGRNKESEAEFLYVVNAQSTYSKRVVHSRLAQLYDVWGKHDLSETHWEKACASDDAPGWAWIMRGANLAQIGEFQSAEACFRKALNCDRCDDDEAYLNLGYVLRAQTNYIDAEAAFRRALEITPDYAEAIEGLYSLEGVLDSINAVHKLLTD